MLKPDSAEGAGGFALSSHLRDSMDANDQRRDLGLVVDGVLVVPPDAGHNRH